MYESILEDWEAITSRSSNVLLGTRQKEPWGTGLVEGAKDLATRTVSQLQEWAEEDPDTWTDDLLRLTGGGIKDVGNTLADWESRSEEGEIGLRSAAGTALRFMNWSSEKGADIGGAAVGALGGHEDIGRFIGSFLPEAIGTKGLSKAAQIGKTTKQLRKLRKLGYGLQVDDITKGRHAFAYADEVLPDPSLLDDLGTAVTSNKTARRRLDTATKQADNLAAFKEVSPSIREAFTNIPPGASVQEVKKALGPTKHFRQLRNEFRYFNPDEIALDKELLRRMQGREEALIELHKKQASLELDRVNLAEKYSHLTTKAARKDAGVHRLFKSTEKKLKETGKAITEFASENPFVKSPRIYGIQGIRTKVKEAIEAFNNPLNRWHHINRSADTGKSMLAELSQDPYIAVNLFAHMKKNKIYSSGIMENLSLILEAPHNKWHAKMKGAGYEPTHFVKKLNKWAETEASIFQYMEEVSKTVLKGTKYTEKAGKGLGGTILPPDPNSVNQLFELMTSYGKLQKEINKELFTKYDAKRFEDIPGVKEIIANYRWRGKKPNK